MFQYNLLKSKKTQETYSFARGTDDRILTAAARLLAMDVVDIIIGHKKQIESRVLELGLVLIF
jgi:phosphate acetyltransferase